MKNWYYGFLLSFALVACQSEPQVKTSNNTCDPTPADLQYFVTPTEIFTGANGRNLYQAVLQANFGDFEIVSNNPDIADVEPYDCLAPFQSGVIAVITAKSGGTTDLTLTSAALTETITVNVADYTTEQYDLGNQRYNTPANGNQSDRVACASCHTGADGVPHSPLALSNKSDNDLLMAIENSQYPDICENDLGGVCNCTPVGEDCSACPETDCMFNSGSVLSLEAFGGAANEHNYDLTSAESTAVMAYMRAIKLDL